MNAERIRLGERIARRVGPIKAGTVVVIPVHLDDYVRVIHTLLDAIEVLEAKAMRLEVRLAQQPDADDEIPF